MKPRTHIILIGLTGSGKTTLGRTLAEILKIPFYDIDAEIVKATQQSIDEIFKTKGEASFRSTEAEVLKKYCTSLVPAVIATGGGAVLDPENVSIMKDSGMVIRILRSPEAILSTIDVSTRPLLAKNPEYLHRLAEEREPFYKAAADVTIFNESHEALEQLICFLEDRKSQ